MYLVGVLSMYVSMPIHLRYPAGHRCEAAQHSGYIYYDSILRRVMKPIHGYRPNICVEGLDPFCWALGVVLPRELLQFFLFRL